MSSLSRCSSPESKPDWKAYALGELAPDLRKQAETHASTCSACGEELASLRLTLDMMSTLREEEIPRRIAFVSDKVFEPRWWERGWWQRIFNPTFASACVIAAAIVVHAYAKPAITEAQVNAAVDKAIAQLQVQQLDAQVADRQQIEDVKQFVIASVGLQRQ
jgi:anti-sigma factor RsiW